VVDTKVGREVRAAIDAARSCALDARSLEQIDWEAAPSTATALHPAWDAEAALPAAVRERLGVSREDLDEAAAHARAGGPWLTVMAAANALGYASSSHGAWRTARIAALPEVERRLADAVATLDAEGPVAAYYLLANEGHLHGWGPAYFTRFLAAADGRGDDRAVILTPEIALGVNRLLVVDEIAAADWPTVDYAFHHALLHRIATDVGSPVAMVENLLQATTAP